ncbi:MAG TPA: hypothetical protein VET29_11020, partial [Actinophytocola sp.]|nr:hypothetical protein [Actinophytocola sp.]
MGEIQIPSDGFWGPIYYSMYALTGMKPPAVLSEYMYALADSTFAFASALQQGSYGVQGLASGVLANIRGDTAHAFAGYSAHLDDDVPSYAAMLVNMGNSANAFGLNGEETEYQILFELANFAWEIYLALSSGVFAAASVGAIIAKGRAVVGRTMLLGRENASRIGTRLSHTIGVTKPSAVKRVGSLGGNQGGVPWRLVLSPVDEAIEEGGQDFGAQSITSVKGHRKGFSWDQIGVSAAFGAAVGVNASAQHVLLSMNRYTRDFMKSIVGAGVTGVTAEFLPTFIGDLIMGSKTDVFGLFSPFFTDSIHRASHKFGDRFRPDGGSFGGAQSPPPPPPVQQGSPDLPTLSLGATPPTGGTGLPGLDTPSRPVESTVDDGRLASSPPARATGAPPGAAAGAGPSGAGPSGAGSTVVPGSAGGSADSVGAPLGSGGLGGAGPVGVGGSGGSVGGALGSGGAGGLGAVGSAGGLG